MFKNYVSAKTPSTSEFWKNLSHDKREDLIKEDVLIEERKLAEENNFNITPVVKEHRGLKRQEEIEREKKILREVQKRVDLIKEDAREEGKKTGDFTSKINHYIWIPKSFDEWFLKVKFPNIKYISVGFGKEESNLLKLSKELDIEKNVIFLKDINFNLKTSLIGESNLFLMPSRIEKKSVVGFGLSFIEAASYGIGSIGG